MDISGILKAVDELKAQIAKDYGSALTKEELIEVLEETLLESRRKELKRKFSVFGPEYLVAAIKNIKAGESIRERSEHGNQESRESIRAGTDASASRGPRIVKAARQPGKS